MMMIFFPLLLIITLLPSFTASMKSFPIASSSSDGKQMPAVGLGTWKSAPNDVKAAVKEAIKAGYRCIDCAAFYGNEKEIGEAFQECFKEGIVERKDLWITSKLWCDCMEPQHVQPALQKTIDDLQCDYLDLYLIHWPIPLKHGVAFPANGKEELSPEECPMKGTWKALEECVDKKMTTHIGVSNFSMKKLQDLLAIARIKPAVNQFERHPYLQQQKLVQFCKDNGIFVTNYSSLGSLDRPEGLKSETESNLLEDPVIVEIANKVKSTPGAVLLKWAIQEGTAVIPKSTNPDRLKANLLVGDESCFELDEDDMKRIKALDKHARYITGAFWVFPDGPYTLQNVWDE